MTSSRSARTRFELDYDVIPPDRNRARADSRPAPQRASDVSDAEFEVVRGPQPTRRSPLFNHAPQQDNRASARARDASTIRHSASRNAPLRIRWSLRTLAAGAAGVAVVMAILLSLVRQAPETGLVITGVQQSPVDSNGLRVIELSGSVENRTGEPAALPALVAEVRSESGAINRSSVSLGDHPLPAGGAAHFSVRLPSPGGKHPEVSVSFASKGV